jgi:uncharacterized Zn-finger protein
VSHSFTILYEFIANFSKLSLPLDSVFDGESASEDLPFDGPFPEPTNTHSFNCSSGSDQVDDSVSRTGEKDDIDHTTVKRAIDAPYACPFCPYKSFGRRCDDDQHMLTHEKIRENGYKCFECDTRFVRKIDLARHHKSQHTLDEDGGCKCPLCEKHFRRMDILWQHRENEYGLS